MPTLLVLDVFGNRLADVNGVAGAPLLQELQLGANPVTDLTPLLNLGSLVNLGLDQTHSTRLTGVDQLPRRRDLRQRPGLRAVWNPSLRRTLAVYSAVGPA
jgi:hypothetical protein